MKVTEKTALIWRESVYRNGFRCWCGRELANGKGLKPDRRLLNSMDERGFCKCPDCRTPVLMVRPYNGPEMPGTFGGRWKGAM